MNARELMTPNPQVMTGNEPVSHAARIMRDFDVGLVPVVDDRAHLHLRGVITDRDIAIRCVAERHAFDRAVEDFMTVDHLMTVGPDADVHEVMHVMEDGRVRRLLVVENGRVAGIIAQADLALKEGPREPLKVEHVLERISAPVAVAR
jgi:CBS domain-containing protein